MQSQDVLRFSATAPNMLHEATQNGLLAKLSPGTLEAIRENAARVRLVHGQVIAERDQALGSVYFLVSGLVCLVQEAGQDDARQEALADSQASMPQLAMVGRDGSVGLMELLIGCGSALSCALVQVGGIALRVECDPLRKIIQNSPELHAAAWRFMRHMTRQLMDGSTSNATAAFVGCPWRRTGWAAARC